jgi:hypothetical protein
LFGLILYYPTIATVIILIPRCAAPPVFAVAAGSIAGLMADFKLRVASSFDESIGQLPQ